MNSGGEDNPDVAIKSRLFALDFDNTFTADPIGLSACVRLLTAMGHRFICASSRQRTEENADDIDAMLESHGCPMTVYLTSGAAKEWYLKQRGVVVDIWIDDGPWAITNGI